jgi:osmoprotectant transport system permease protein
MASSIPHQIGAWFTTWSNFTGSDGAFVRLGQHVEISLESVAIAAAIAVPVGVALARARRGGLIVTTLANGARAIPILGVLILLAVGPFGVGTTAAVVALVIFAIPPMLTNTYTGVRQVDADVRDAAVGMGLTTWQIMLRVELPLAVPLIATGVRLATVQVWATATLSALVGSGGLGELIVTGFGIADYGQLYGGVILVAASAIAIDALLAGSERRIRRRYGGAPVQPARLWRRRVQPV